MNALLTHAIEYLREQRSKPYLNAEYVRKLDAAIRALKGLLPYS